MMNSGEVAPNVRRSADAALSPDFLQWILPEGEQINPEAGEIVTALGREWLTSITIEAAEVARRRGSTTVEPEDVEFAVQTLFGGDKALTGTVVPRSEQQATTAPSSAHLARLEMLEKFRNAQEC